MTLYRGCDYQGRFGMSWTDLQWIAHGCALEGQRTRSPLTAVYACEVPPDALLGHMYGKDWSEYVVDPAYLNDGTVREVFRLYRDGVPASAQAVDSVYAKFEENMRVGSG
ncbi:hypothetical protein [Mycobacterium cookii]|uniref:hypothetical protein n=1 Tax=Mycobacterium cookii TaxID=1775 RepID=UPI0013D55810|nr:hypothetical protein [Mycobacterium cookii]MCV7330091.1 hypothetical protein [Mycobacterium cookii]